MKKRFFAMLLCVVLVLSMIPAVALADVSVASQADLNAAIAAATTETINLADGSYTLSGTIANKTLTFKGSKNAVISVPSAVNASNSNLTFDGVTVKFENADYRGFQHMTNNNTLTYKNCALEGQQFLYATNVVFEDCEFTVKGNYYSVWTYGASNVLFDGCKFNTSGKAILVYTEAAHEAAITVNNCEFISDGSAATDKAAVEVGQSAYGNKSTYLISINNSKQTGFAANNSDSPLYGNKNDMDPAGLTVFVDGKDVTSPAIPETGDGMGLFVCAGLMLVSAIGLALSKKRGYAR